MDANVKSTRRSKNPIVPSLPLCNMSNIAASYQNINVEAAEIIDVMQREEYRVLQGSIILI